MTQKICFCFLAMVVLAWLPENSQAQLLLPAQQQVQFQTSRVSVFTSKFASNPMCQLYPMYPICGLGGFAASDGMIEGVGRSRSGSRNYLVYLPEAVKTGALKNAPVMVMLHGCLQTPELIANATEMNAFAERYGFVVVYPEQTGQYNLQSCWNWYAPENLRRSGEAEIITEITSDVVRLYGLDASRVYVSGMSAGGAMSSILLACYSDVFAAGAIHSGLAFGAADNPYEASLAMQGHATFDANQLAARAYECSPRRTTPLPVLIIHGDRDTTISIRNAEENVALFENLNDLIDDGKLNHSATVSKQTVEIPATESGRLPATIVASGKPGQSLVEFMTVHGMGHAWSGGAVSGSYTEPAGPSASEFIVHFFKLDRPAGSETNR